MQGGTGCLHERQKGFPRSSKGAAAVVGCPPQMLQQHARQFLGFQGEQIVGVGHERVDRLHSANDEGLPVARAEIADGSRGRVRWRAGANTVKDDGPPAAQRLR